jgi:DNA-directed RNA polymerase sigma subunit (sigma70/sigma32)
VDNKELLKEYLAEAASYALIRRDQEQELLNRGRSGDKAALTQLMHSYIEMVAILALKLTPQGVDAIEAIQAANEATIELLRDSSVDEPLLQLVETIRRAVSR